MPAKLRVLIERNPPIFRPGEAIAGHVEVEIVDRCRCDALTLTSGWKTDGKGSTAKGEIEKPTLFQGEWNTPGKKLRYPFSLRAPAGPLSYSGTIVNLTWTLRADADIPWDFDPKTEAVFVLAPWDSESRGAIARGYRGKPQNLVESYAQGIIIPPEGTVPKPVNPGPTLLALSAICFIGAFFIAAIAEPAWIGFASFGFMSLVLLLVGLASMRKKAEIGKPRLLVEPRSILAGEDITVTFEIITAEDLALKSGKIRVLGKEVAESGSGSSYEMHVHPLLVEDRSLSPEARRVSKGRRTLIHKKFRVPQGAPPSFKVSDNAVQWSVRAEIQAEDGREWSEEQIFEVRPGQA